MIRWFFLCLIIFLSWHIAPVFAADCDQYQCNKDTQDTSAYLSCNKDKQSCLEAKIKVFESQAVTLNSTISILNGQIQVQQLQINQTLAEIEKLEKEVTELATRISGLEISLDRLTKVLVERVNQGYKRSTTSPLFLLLTTGSFSDAMSEYKYLQIAQKHVGEVMQQAENQRLNYDEQKHLKEEKQAEVEKKRTQLQAQQSVITKQKKEQEFLLQETRSSEAIYKKELAATLAELQAIQSIIAGQGTESSAGEVKEGDTIASIIVGASACSTGTHLHFEVVRNGGHQDPAGYLKSISAEWQNSPDGPFSFGGDWNWPLNNPAKINQGYGMTYYARVKRSYGGQPHTGIDIASKSSDYGVKAVKTGTLYRGSIKCGGGQLRYVRVDHADSDLNTYYLHVNY